MRRRMYDQPAFAVAQKRQQVSAHVSEGSSGWGEGMERSMTGAQERDLGAM